jgi:hypothetical protein
MFRAAQYKVVIAAIVLAACSDDTTAKPQVIFSGNTETGAGLDCRDSNELFDVGDFGNPAATPPKPSVSVSDGSAAGQGTASVSCSVKANGTDSFAVSATVVESGATGGLFTVEGTFKTTGEQDGIRVVASSKQTANQYIDNGKCVVAAYTGTQGVAAGRVWGTISCPDAVNTADSNRACVVKAEFRFENCAQ